MENRSVTLKPFVAAFLSKLETVVSANVSAQVYPATYLSHLLKHAEYYLLIYCNVLERLLQHTSIPKENLTIADIGAGNGLLGLFARHCGFSKVWINDSDPSFIEAAKSLAGHLKLDIGGFVCSDLEQIPGEWKGRRIDAFLGTDVIEHIYDLRKFFETLQEVNPHMVSVFTTASNPANKFKVRQLEKLQQKDELTGGTPEDFALFGSEAHPSFFSIRQHIIERAAPHLSKDIVNDFAARTRGMRQQDIVTAVNRYIATNELPAWPHHPTNTCNPYTGSWTERVLTFDEYKSLYANFNLRLTIYDGFYNSRKPFPQSMASVLLNKIIPILGHRLSPYLVLVGDQPQKKLSSF